MQSIFDSYLFAISSWWFLDHPRFFPNPCYQPSWWRTFFWSFGHTCHSFTPGWKPWFTTQRLKDLTSLMVKPHWFVEDAAGDAKKISSTLRSLPGTPGSPSGTHYSAFSGAWWKTKSSNEAARPELQRVVLLTVGKPWCPLVLGWVCELNRAGDGFAMIWLTLHFSTLCVLFFKLLHFFLSGFIMSLVTNVSWTFGTRGPGFLHSTCCTPWRCFWFLLQRYATTQQSQHFPQTCCSRKGWSNLLWFQCTLQATWILQLALWALWCRLLVCIGAKTNHYESFPLVDVKMCI